VVDTNMVTGSGEVVRTVVWYGMVVEYVGRCGCVLTDIIVWWYHGMVWYGSHLSEGS
jgi:hypothetical protein